MPKLLQKLLSPSNAGSALHRQQLLTRIDAGTATSLIIPASSLFDAEQLTQLRRMSPQLHTLNTKIFNASPRHARDVIAWWTMLDELHQGLGDIIHEAAGYAPEKKDHTPNW